MRAAVKDGEADLKSANRQALKSANSQATGELQIRTLIDGMANAIRTKDVNALMACYAPHVLVFDLLPPLQYAGAEPIRKRVSQWLSSFKGSVGFEMRNLSITTGEDVAFCHSLNGVTGTSKDGSQIDMWWRATNCLRKIESRWLITHGHSSVPFDMESGKALLDLKP